MENGQHYERMKELKEFDETKRGVKGLSDSRITSLPTIFLHSPESLSDVHKNSPEYSDGISIPLIDLSGMNSPTERPKIVDQVKEAAKTWGFFQVVNHGIPIAAMEETLSAARAFYDLPYDEKAKYYKRSPEPRGVKHMSNHDLFHAPAASWRDTLQVWGPDHAAEDVPRACRAEVAAWFSRASEVGEALMGLLANGLGLERKKFKDLSFMGSQLFVGNFYPPCPEPDRTMGFTSHTDPVFLTILMQGHIPGLQVKHGHDWVNVDPIPGGLIVNVGDLLQIVSNGEYKSVKHRVLANSYKETRTTVSVFFNPNKWDGCLYGPLPELLSPEKPAIYRNFTLMEFLDNYFKRALTNKSLIDQVKI